jgi:hypothetical protein
MGYEFITQPQVFLAPITATAGVNALPPEYPLLTSYLYWTETITVPKSGFQVPHNGRPILNQPGSFVINVGGVLQSPSKYDVDQNLRRITFKEVISTGLPLEANFIQLATHAPSSQYFDFIDVNNGIIRNLAGINLTATHITVLSSTFAGQTFFDTVTAVRFVALSSTVKVGETRVFPTTSISITANEAYIRDRIVTESIILTSGGGSEEWNATYSIVSSLSANWFYQGTDVKNLTGNWQSTYGTVSTLSANWDNRAVILPTVTNYLSTKNVLISTATITDRLITDFKVVTVTTNPYTFNNNDKSKIFHFNTTTTPVITALLPRSLSNGFNTGIINTGTGVVYISSAQAPFINAPGVFNSIQHTGMYIYKTGNQFFGVGVFE